MLRLRECGRADLDERRNEEVDWLVQSTRGVALFPKDISPPPREWAERFFNVQRWTEMTRGGHFAAMEQPEALAEDIRTWFRAFR
jgi:pimeloyl-ACP methyl ester carboxylesterase